MPRPQRQDALNDQMFDVLCALRAGDCNDRVSAWLLRAFFGATAPVSATFDPLPDDFADRLSSARRTAVEMGCYDAADWLRYNAPQLLGTRPTRT